MFHKNLVFNNIYSSEAPTPWLVLTKLIHSSLSHFPYKKFPRQPSHIVMLCEKNYVRITSIVLYIFCLAEGILVSVVCVGGGSRGVCGQATL